VRIKPNSSSIQAQPGRISLRIQIISWILCHALKIYTMVVIGCRAQTGEDTEFRYFFINAILMKIRILTVGKIKDQNLDAQARDYLHRIGHYFPAVLEHIKEEKIKSLGYEEIRSRESRRLAEKLHPQDVNVVLDKDGKLLTSEEFAGFIHKSAVQGIPRLCFIIGGPLGLGNPILAGPYQHLSLSRMTFPHELVVVMLLEQIYRGASILKGIPYHK